MLTGKAYAFDESLLVGLPGALTKKPDDRSSFDSMVLQAFESQIMTKIAEAEQSMMVEMPGREARAAVVQSSRSAHEAVKERSAHPTHQPGPVRRSNLYLPCLCVRIFQSFYVLL